MSNLDDVRKILRDYPSKDLEAKTLDEFEQLLSDYQHTRPNEEKTTLATLIEKHKLHSVQLYTQLLILADLYQYVARAFKCSPIDIYQYNIDGSLSSTTIRLIRCIYQRTLEHFQHSAFVDAFKWICFHNDMKTLGLLLRT